MTSAGSDQARTAGGGERSPDGPARIDAVLFDMDGVITDTARAHAEVWKSLFDDVLAARPEPQPPFDLEHDYLAFVDGRPRYDGVACFLGSRDIDLPRGAEDDGPGELTICGLGNRKNDGFRRWLDTHAVEPYPATVRLLGQLRAAGVKVAAFSASRNAGSVIEKAGVAGLFDARVDASDLERLGRPGKPDPAMLQEAAARLGVAPARVAVIEDAVAGIEAGVRGGFGLVVGVDRGGNAAALRQAGAHVIVQGLAELGYTPAAGLGLKSLARRPLARDRADEVRALVAGRRLAVFLDYDGTLTPIVEDYTKAVLSDRMREAVAALGRRCTVAVVSGRDVTVVRELVGLDGIYYAGSHGFEIRGPDGQTGGLEKGVEYLPVLDRVEARLRASLAAVSGHAVERKRFEISVHYRRVADADVSAVERAVDEAMAGEAGLRKGHGKKVFRVQPAIEWDKGHAVLWLLQQLALGQPDLLPVYVGDDITDEDAFRALGGRGLTLAVRDVEDRTTAADYALADTDDVERILRTLADLAGDTT